MFLDLGLLRVLLSGLLQSRNCLVDLASLELGPAERIGDRCVVRCKFARLADHRFGRIDILSPLEFGIAKKVEQRGLIRSDRQGLLERYLGLWPTLCLFKRASLQEQQVRQLTPKIL